MDASLNGTEQDSTFTPSIPGWDGRRRQIGTRIFGNLGRRAARMGHTAGKRMLFGPGGYTFFRPFCRLRLFLFFCKSSSLHPFSGSILYLPFLMFVICTPVFHTFDFFNRENLHFNLPLHLCKFFTIHTSFFGIRGTGCIAQRWEQKRIQGY